MIKPFLLALAYILALQPYTAVASPFTPPPDYFLNPTLTPPDGSAWSDGVYDTYANLCPGCWWGTTDRDVLVSYGLLASPISQDVPGYIGSGIPEVAVWGNIVIAPDSGTVGTGVVSTSPPASVPEPGWLLATGLVMLIALREARVHRRFHRRARAAPR